MEATLKYQQERSANQLAMAEDRCHNSILELKRVQQRYSETERDCEVLRSRDVHRDNEIRELRRVNGALREEMERETKRMSAAVVAHQDELYALQQTHQAEVKEVNPPHRPPYMTLNHINQPNLMNDNPYSNETLINLFLTYTTRCIVV